MVGRACVQAIFYLIKAVNFLTTGDNLKLFHMPRSSIFAVYLAIAVAPTSLDPFFHVHTVTRSHLDQDKTTNAVYMYITGLSHKLHQP